MSVAPGKKRGEVVCEFTSRVGRGRAVGRGLIAGSCVGLTRVSAAPNRGGDGDGAAHSGEEGLLRLHEADVAVITSSIMVLRLPTTQAAQVREGADSLTARVPFSISDCVPISLCGRSPAYLPHISHVSPVYLPCMSRLPSPSASPQHT